MLHIERWKVVMILVLTGLGILYAMPNVLSPSARGWVETNMPSWAPSKTVNLGLDLQGGSHILLQADTHAAISDRMDAMVDAARSEMRKKSIGYTGLEAQRDRVVFRLRDPARDRDNAYKIARSLEEKADVEIADDGRAEIVMGENVIREINSQVISQSIEIVRRRIDETGTKEPIIQRQGTDRIVVQLPGVDDPQRIKELLGKTAKMTFHLVDTDGTGRRLPMRNKGEGTPSAIMIKKRAVITGDMLTDSQPSFEQGAPVVSFRFNALGAKKFCDVTRENVGKPFAIVLDDEVISAPVIRDAICGGAGIISGNFTVKEAHDLSLLLRAGALPAPLNVVEERSVGPTLGSDSVASGKTAFSIAFAVIFVLMIASYGLFGFFANIALFLNMVFILGLLSILQATLTLPGIAGIILTIGMAVDANVLIYERIREELRSGRSVIASVDSGYRMAIATIVDSNMTTLIVAIILFSFGSGPVKGFAVAMSVGIVTSMFSAISITRLIVAEYLKHKRPVTLNL